MSKALGIVYRAIATHLTHKAGYTKTIAQSGRTSWSKICSGAATGWDYFPY